MSERRTASPLSFAVFFLSFFLASCAGLPQAIPSLADEDLLSALPQSGILYARAVPTGLPFLAGKALASLGPSERKEAEALLKKTREAWIALDRASAAGGSGQGYSLIAFGDYPAARLRMGLSAAKGVAVRKGWFLLPNGLSVAILSSKRIAATTGDMEAFLSRIRAAAAERAEASKHPAAALRARASSSASKPLVALSPDPLSLLFPEGSADFLSLPIEALWVAAAEGTGALDAELSFDFPAEAQARVFTPAIRIMAGVLRMSAGNAPGSWETVREGKSVIMRGIKLDDAALSALMGRLIPAVK